jgi:hypothetical protein
VASIQPGCTIPVEEKFEPSGWLDLSFHSANEFKPHRLPRTSPRLAELFEAVRFVEDNLKRGIPGDQVSREVHRRWPSLDRIELVPATPQKKRNEKGGNRVDDILEMVAIAGDQTDQVPSAGAVPDAIFTRTLIQTIFSSREFRLLERTWQGAGTLLQQTGRDQDASFTLQIVPCSSREAVPDTLERLRAQWADSSPGLVVIDFPCDNTPLSQEWLTTVGQWAESLMVPVAIEIPPGFFQSAGWDEFHKLPYLDHLLDDSLYAKWNHARRETFAHWLIPVCNSFLARPPYGEGFPAHPIAFDEPDPLWISPVWVLATAVARSMNATRWPTWFNHPRRCGLENLAVVDLTPGNPRCTETSFTRDRVQQLVKVGINPVQTALGSDNAFLTTATSLAGTRIAAQMVLNRLLTTIFRALETADPADPDARTFLLNLIGQVFLDSGHPEPEELSVTPVPGDQSDGLYRVLVKPPPSVPAGEQALEFRIRI